MTLGVQHKIHKTLTQNEISISFCKNLDNKGALLSLSFYKMDHFRGSNYE